jgi:hypothetical protein
MADWETHLLKRERGRPVIPVEKKQGFDRDGHTTVDTFSSDLVDSFVETFKVLLAMQREKLRLPATNSFEEDLTTLEKLSHSSLLEVLAMTRHSQAGHALASAGTLAESAAVFLNSSPERLVISGPSMFVNFPSSSKLKYTWHSEQNWYPKRRKFLNVWCPIIRDRTQKNSMEVLPESHEKDWFYFSEYTGYGGVFDDNANVQYEIPENFLQEYNGVIPDVKVGEGLFFDGKLVHRSLDNFSESAFFTLVFRVFDYSNDLTLSSNWADIPYNRKSVGWPNINVKPAH